MNLTDLANKYCTDKGTVTGAGHGYTLVYDMLFNSLRNQPINFLEIGLCAGGPEVDGPVNRATERLPSVSMWREYFPQAMIYGLDISDFSDFQTNWFRFFRADCGSRDELGAVIRTGVQFDVIIDDGSHASYHQQTTLDVLFPALKPGGLYVIEDLDWQPTTYEAQLPKVEKTTDFLKRTSYGTLLTFSDDALASLRKPFNKSRSLKAPISHHVDEPTVRGYLRRLLTPSPVKLAVIQKLS
ncbi:hypothetical protein JQ581_17490 [Bradyrhizobium liaoningense]|uniref:hypothetical protein n=1 Tax=Bradyrhizobium liaoningense TaxID=43992 RepID=UPI001BA45E34|nr:hypothetical protein [Bradyrhizobium liaoningense]MBR0738732.1 hypothetical protein [Bradyrhizobium liaoningense]